MDLHDPAVAAGRAVPPAFAVVLLLAMAFATFGALAIGILARFIIDDFDITREQLGYVLSANVVIAACGSPLAGGLTDRLGSRAALGAVFGLAALSFLMLAIAPAYWVLMAAAVVAAIGQSAGNPATNKLIAEHVAVGRRGYVTGIKQSGAELGLVLGGPALPAAAIVIGWRWTLGIVACVAMLCLVLASAVVPKNTGQEEELTHSGRSRLPVAIGWLAVYGGLMGLAGAVTFFIPLFVEEGLDGSPALGGIAVAFAGLAAFVARIVWAGMSERFAHYQTALGLIAALSVVGVAILAGAAIAFPLLWVGVIVVGVSMNSWNSVGMLAIIAEVAPAQVGRASGIVLLGFLTGLGVGPPLYGRTIDQSGSYNLMWIIALASVLAALLLIGCWRRSMRPTSRLPITSSGC
ncbi:MAG: MFS transporter [Acidimicrobiales bacterium]